MSKKANKTFIGVFVVAAIVMLVAAVLIFGSGKFFQNKEQYVAFFEGSVKGLRIGAPVRGARAALPGADPARSTAHLRRAAPRRPSGRLAG